MGMQQRTGFLESPEGIDIIRTLRMMMEDSAFNTPDTYSSNNIDYPDNMMPFVDKHLKYLNAHPKLNPNHYIANLKLMSRKR
jgi:hypothetical protein